MKSVGRERLVLASASPRRAELLRKGGFEFEVMVSPLAEPSRKPAGIAVEFWPMSLAYLKAAAVLALLRKSSGDEGAVILAADTIVVLESARGPQILNKAADRSHARRMLQRLSGRKHRVITGVCVLWGDHRRLVSAEAVCRMRKLSSARLETYLDSGLWKGKAGAYGIQDKHDEFVTLLKGEISTVIGLPMAVVRNELARFGNRIRKGKP